jgi:cell division septum initiation protein DivIVA
MSIKNKKISKIEKIFSENQVMTLLESISNGIVLLSENRTGLKEKFNEFKREVKEFKKETCKASKK